MMISDEKIENAIDDMACTVEDLIDNKTIEDKLRAIKSLKEVEKLIMKIETAD